MPHLDSGTIVLLEFKKNEGTLAIVLIEKPFVLDKASPPSQVAN